jgi:predicted O-methyltransferase YrrM
MNSLIERIYSTGLVEDAEGNSTNAFPTSISQEMGTALYKLIKEKNLNNTLEIGMAYGLSSLFICQAHRDKDEGLHNSIDPFQKKTWNSIGLSNIQRSNLDDILTFHEAPSHEALPRMLQGGSRFDFIFIDGSHLFDYVLVDFFYADKLLKNGGYVMFDDTWMPSVSGVVSFILLNRGYEVARGWGKGRVERLPKIKRIVRGKKTFKFRGRYLILRKISDDDREWDYHENF